MEPGHILHEADALTLHRVGHYDRGPALVLLGLPEGLEELGVAVSVYLQYVPVECLPLVRQGVQADHVLGAPVYLQPVPIHDGCEVVQLQVGGQHGCLPDQALITLAVPQEAVDPDVFSV